ncbi:hypothetical protein [Rubrivirga sp.]|uniref:hypothetical protein n=1 Tax=Rubrivirga sp. TaxID=1885344 RepID=UPI003B51BBF2
MTHRTIIFALGLVVASAARAQPIQVNVPTFSIGVAETATAAVTITGTGTAPVLAYEARFAVDPSVAEFVGVSLAGTASEGWTVVVNSTSPGRFVVSAASATPLASDGPLFSLTLEGVGVGASSLSLPYFRANEGSPEVAVEDGTVVVGGSVSSEPDPSVQRLSVYPNPTSGQVRITGPCPTPSPTLHVWTVTGRLVARTSEPECGPWDLDFGALPAGVYSVGAPGVAPVRVTVIR